MPKDVKALLEAKRGFANYHFNTVERTRTWNRCVARGDFHEATGQWLLKGELAGGGDAEFRLTDGLAACTLPGGHLERPIGDDLVALTDPPGSGGLLAALHLWRRLLVVGPERFGNLNYLGTVPLVDPQDFIDRRAMVLLAHDRGMLAGADQGLCDALVGTYGGVECRFLFDPKSGNVVAMELYRSPDDDPCELYFADYGEVEGRVFPRHIEVRYGDSTYATIKLAEVKLDKAGAK